MTYKIKTGFASIDMLIGGINIGTVNLVTSDSTGSGKTTFLTKLATNVVNKEKYNIVVFNSQKDEDLDFSRVKLSRFTNILHTTNNVLVDIVKLMEIKNLTPQVVIFDDLLNLSEHDYVALKQFAVNYGCAILVSNVSPTYYMYDTIFTTSIEGTSVAVKVNVNSCPLVNNSKIEHTI